MDKQQITFTIIKPDAVANGYIGTILEKINASGFKIVAMKLTKMQRRDAEIFYAIHREKPFFDDLVMFMSSGPIVAAILEKENAVSDFRALIGATDPAQSATGTIRQLYAGSMSRNAIHGADSDENALIEANFFFPQRDCYL